MELTSGSGLKPIGEVFRVPSRPPGAASKNAQSLTCFTASAIISIKLKFGRIHDCGHETPLPQGARRAAAEPSS